MIDCDSPADELREIYLSMAEIAHTPVSYWERLTLRRLNKWISAISNREKKREQT